MRNVAEDVRGITQSVKTDVAAVGDTVRVVNAGVRSAVKRAEERLKRLDALVEVAQEEAEEFVLSSASALRGVRIGANALRRTFQFARRNGLKRRQKRRPRREEAPTPTERARGDRPRIRTRVADES